MDLCTNVTIKGGEFVDVDGEYHTDGIEYRRGMPVFVRQQGTAHQLYMNSNGAWYLSTGHSDGVVMSNKFWSVCPAGTGVYTGWVGSYF